LASDLDILFMSGLAPPPGGIEVWMARMLEQAERFQIRPEVINLRSPRPEASETLAPFKFGFAAALLRRCIAACRRNFDLMHINCSVRRWSAARDYGFLRIARWNDIPVVVHLHGGLAGGREWRHHPALARLCYRKLLESADAVIVLADEVIHDLERAGIEMRRLVKIPNFLPPAWLDPNGPVRPAAERRGVLYTGRLTAEKGLASLIHLAERLPDQEFHWVGPLDEQIRIPSNVSWHGEKDHGELPEHYASCAVFLFPSQSEGFPNAVLEAMAAAMPVISTLRGAIPEMIVHGRGGFLREPGEVDAMAEDLEKLVGDPEMRARIGQFNRHRVESEYTAARVLPHLRMLYDELARGGE
jgi:glycosyltransferase involved in cell wall biosynthesis